MKDELEKCFEFIVELEKLKAVTRRVKPIGQDRYETSAEHSWQAALTALVLAKFGEEGLDAARVSRMLLVHDICEIDADDVRSSRDDDHAAGTFGGGPGARQELDQPHFAAERVAAGLAHLADHVDHLAVVLLDRDGDLRILEEPVGQPPADFDLQRVLRFLARQRNRRARPVTPHANSAWSLQTVSSGATGRAANSLAVSPWSGNRLWRSE